MTLESSGEAQPRAPWLHLPLGRWKTVRGGWILPRKIREKELQTNERPQAEGARQRHLSRRIEKIISQHGRAGSVVVTIITTSIAAPLGRLGERVYRFPQAAWRAWSLFWFSRQMFSMVFFFFAARLDSEDRRFCLCHSVLATSSSMTGTQDVWRPVGAMSA